MSSIAELRERESICTRLVKEFTVIADNAKVPSYVFTDYFNQPSNHYVPLNAALEHKKRYQTELQEYNKLVIQLRTAEKELLEIQTTIHFLGTFVEKNIFEPKTQIWINSNYPLLFPIIGSETIQKMIRNLLEHNGYNVEFVFNGSIDGKAFVSPVEEKPVEHVNAAISPETSSEIQNPNAITDAITTFKNNNCNVKTKFSHNCKPIVEISANINNMAEILFRQDCNDAVKKLLSADHEVEYIYYKDDPNKTISVKKWIK